MMRIDIEKPWDLCCVIICGQCFFRRRSGSLISEGMYSGSIFYPYHQNVLWTFLLSLLLITAVEKCRTRFKPVTAKLSSAGLVLLGFFLGYAIMADYYGVGVDVEIIGSLIGIGWYDEKKRQRNSKYD